MTGTYPCRSAGAVSIATPTKIVAAMARIETSPAGAIRAGLFVEAETMRGPKSKT